MAKTREQILEKYRNKLSKKSGVIATNWNAAKEKMKAGYAATPFKASRKAAYNTMIDATTHPGIDVEKAVRNYTLAMFD